MKQTLFTLLLFSTIGLVSCRKKGVDQNIQQYDQSQILNYISANGITGMVKDTSGGDTTGIYYKIILPGNKTTTPLTYTSKVSFVFYLRSFDGKYSSVDTIANHYDGYVGHIVTDALPNGLMLSIINDLKYSGGSMRILIPSRLAYGVSGYGSGSTETTNTHIAGNQCLDYYVHIIDDEKAYDDMVIQNYIKHENFTGYIRTRSTSDTTQYYYYKLDKAGTGTTAINQNSTIESTYTTLLLNNIIVDDENADSVALEVPNLLIGQQEALTHAVKGSLISMILPSGLCYSQNSTSTIPVNSCLRFEMQVIDVTP